MLFCVFLVAGEKNAALSASWGHHIMLQGSQVLLNGVSGGSCCKSQQGSDSVVPQHRPWGDLALLLHAATPLLHLQQQRRQINYRHQDKAPRDEQPGRDAPPALQLQSTVAQVG